MRICEVWCIATSSRPTSCCGISAIPAWSILDSPCTRMNKANAAAKSVALQPIWRPSKCAAIHISWTAGQTFGALGVVLYELLTGRRPFRGTTTAALLEEIELREPKPCRMINDAVPPQLEQICLKCLQKPVSQRYATASDLAESLRRAMDGLPVGAVLPAVPAWSAPKPELAQSLDRACDDNVQFTVYRPKSVQPERWYTCLAFAHLAERPAEALPNEPDPLEEVQRQAEQILGQRAEDYADVRQDSGESVPREGELTFLPVVPGVEFESAPALFCVARGRASRGIPLASHKGSRRKASSRPHECLSGKYPRGGDPTRLSCPSRSAGQCPAGVIRGGGGPPLSTHLSCICRR